MSALREIKTLTVANKRILREFFNSTANTQYKNVRDIRNYMGLETNDEAYEALQYMYNEDIKAQRKLVRKQQAEDKKLLKEMQNVKTIVDMRYTFYSDNLKTENGMSEPFDMFRTQLEKNLTKKAGDTVYMQVSQNGNIVIARQVKLEGASNENIYWKTFHTILSPTSSDGSSSVFFDNYYRIGITENGEIFTPGLDDGSVVRVIVMDTEKLLPVKLQQKFRDGERHCVCGPVYEKLQVQINNAKSEATKKKYNQIANRVLRFEEQYSEGIPEEDMEQFARAIGIRIIMKNILGGTIMSWGPTNNKLSKIEFINTRFNHVECGKLILNSDMQTCNVSDIETIVEQHRQEKLFFFRKYRNGEYTSCLSTKGSFVAVNENYELFKNFNNSINLRNYGYDSIKNSNMHEFIKTGLIINSWPVALCDEPNNLHGVKHIDLSKAYTQHKKCPNYSGFLGVIQQHRLLQGVDVSFMREHIGIYKVFVSESCDFAMTFGIFANEYYVLPSVELLYWHDTFNVKMELVEGVFGSRMDFDYTPEMLEKNSYCTWAGKLAMDKSTTVYEFDGTKEWAQHLTAVLPSNITRGEVDEFTHWTDQHTTVESEEEINLKPIVGYMELPGQVPTITITVPNKTNRVHHHILAFITAYTRINMLETMRTIKGELVKCILDGIYYRGEIDTGNLEFKEKPTIKHSHFKNNWYEECNSNTTCGITQLSPIVENTVAIGQGGSGKTHSVLTDSGFKNVLYVAPTNALAYKCRELYGVNVCTLHKLIGCGIGNEKIPSYKDEFGTPSVILCDELTMSSGGMINQMCEIYKESLLIVCGDIDKEGRYFQCRFGEGEVLTELWTPPSSFKWLEFKNDYRSLDDNLKQLKLDIRSKMRDVFSDGGRIDSLQMKDWIMKTQPTITMDEAVSKFKNGSDIWISGTHAVNEHLLSKNIVSGYLDKKAVSFTQGVKRGSFTIHSFQGMTIADKRIFISLDLFEYAMLYTAVSRARWSHQIVFVRM